MHVVSQTLAGWQVRCLSLTHFYLWTFIFFRCQCEHCRDENLFGAREFRCCREVANASRILTFDGSIERISCVTLREDFMALTNRTVLLQVAPLLRDKEGRKYRRRSEVPENEWVQVNREILNQRSCSATVLFPLLRWPRISLFRSSFVFHSSVKFFHIW